MIEDFFDPEDLKKTSGLSNTSTISCGRRYPDGNDIFAEFSEQKVNEDPEALALHFISIIDTNILPALPLYDAIKKAGYEVKLFFSNLTKKAIELFSTRKEEMLSVTRYGVKRVNNTIALQS